MAWVTVPGSAGIWEYENTATGADTYSGANGTYAGGIRSFTPFGGTLQETYARTRIVGETHLQSVGVPQERGELSKNYYDGQP